MLNDDDDAIIESKCDITTTQSIRKSNKYSFGIQSTDTDKLIPTSSWNCSSADNHSKRNQLIDLFGPNTSFDAREKRKAYRLNADYDLEKHLKSNKSYDLSPASSSSSDCSLEIIDDSEFAALSEVKKPTTALAPISRIAARLLSSNDVFNTPFALLRTSSLSPSEPKVEQLTLIPLTRVYFGSMCYSLMPSSGTSSVSLEVVKPDSNTSARDYHRFNLHTANPQFDDDDRIIYNSEIAGIT